MNATVRYAQSTCILLLFFIDVRYLLNNPEVCEGRKVLDLGCGCGASAIAARLSGASHVVANDIDPSEICVSAPHTLKKKSYSHCDLWNSTRLKALLEMYILVKLVIFKQNQIQSKPKLCIHS